MALYAISDFHLSFTTDKPMNVFGENWKDHHKKIKENWMRTVKEEDTVIIAGDISWSMNIEEGMEDLHWISKLPGKKVLVKGNHDYWWNSISKLNNLYTDMKFIQNNYFQCEDYALCGTRGWICPGGDNFTEHDSKVYKRELIRLKLSLDAALKDGYKKIIIVLHYPPFNGTKVDKEFLQIFKEYNVKKVVFGHLHGIAKENPFNREIDGVEYILTSCDYLDFKLIKIV
ncbi:metallophosphoesterase [Clostridium tetani]|uniref:Serine/threonine protein phosphatase n=1 Tax=Clostridium tetani TaxID=1513 RepID=A0ABY0ESM5_CLOTA|nr:metallophosphoesterase [Clostridium tetani]CDI48392.1 phosphohydrolase [Clostridium tetani 12124569]KHO40148.1 serine/threonine protein phosphatase [Clostridium tetani]RXI41016.1 serine/threonine protein phosphatase [Clostridium tetani]RXI58567.1 serine/threonine protein phosphatase [Clostridium tetani]RXI73279.1 serine/threonine protein phosphatase [Clostridium tetani]